MSIDDNYQIDLVQSIEREGYTHRKLKMEKVGITTDDKSRIIDHFQMKMLSAPGFCTHPADLLDVQKIIIDKQKEERSRYYNPKDPEFPLPVVIHTSQIQDRTAAYLCIDMNYRLLLRYNFINVLAVMKRLDNELPTDVMREVSPKENELFGKIFISLFRMYWLMFINYYVILVIRLLDMVMDSFEFDLRWIILLFL